ncbi:MAG: hypothetical protein ACREST_02865 [Steroidobacteraceae bacterium]
MDYPRRARKLKRRMPGGDGAGDRGELKLAEFSAPRGEEWRWRVPASGEPELTCDWRACRPERGRLH